MKYLLITMATRKGWRARKQTRKVAETNFVRKFSRPRGIRSRSSRSIRRREERKKTKERERERKWNDEEWRSGRKRREGSELSFSAPEADTFADTRHDHPLGVLRTFQWKFCVKGTPPRVPPIPNSTKAETSVASFQFSNFDEDFRLLWSLEEESNERSRRSRGGCISTTLVDQRESKDLRFGGKFNVSTRNCRTNRNIYIYIYVYLFIYLFI